VLRRERNSIEIGNFLKAGRFHAKDWRRQRVALGPGFMMFDDQRPGRQILDTVLACSLLSIQVRRDRFTLPPHLYMQRPLGWLVRFRFRLCTRLFRHGCRYIIFLSSQLYFRGLNRLTSGYTGR